jgi:hypothetical protein
MALRAIRPTGTTRSLDAFSENPDKSGLQIDAGHFQSDQFRYPQSGSVKQFQHGGIPQAFGLVPIRCIDQGFHVGYGQHVRQLQSGFGQVDVSGRILFDDFSWVRNLKKPRRLTRCRARDRALNPLAPQVDQVRQDESRIDIGDNGRIFYFPDNGRICIRSAL